MRTRREVASGHQLKSINRPIVCVGEPHAMGCRLPAVVDGPIQSRDVINAYLDLDLVVLVERTPEGIRESRYPGANCCFLKAQDVNAELYRMLRDSKKTHEVRTEGDWIRVRWIDRGACKFYCQQLEKRGIQTYEGDVSPLLRYLIDNDIRPAAPKIAYLDIETDSRVWFSRKEEARVLSWAVVDNDGNEFTGLLKSFTDERERELLEELWRVLEPYDLLTGWNAERFDFPVLEARMCLLGIPVRWHTKLLLCQLELFKRMNTMAAKSGSEKQSYKLENICQEVLGYGKDDFDASQTYEAWAAGGVERKRMCTYNLKDARLLRELEKETGYIQLLGTLGEACGTFANGRGAQPSVQVEGFMHQLAKQRGYRFPSRFNRRKETSKFAGAYVMELSQHSAGILKQVHVADFKSLYPSIILSWNIGPDTKVINPEHIEPEARAPMLAFAGTSWSPLTDVQFDVQTPSILAMAIKEMLRLRKSWSTEQAKHPPETPAWHDARRRSMAYKIAANSFYGVVGAPSSRFFDRQAAESVAQCGVWLIQETIRAAEDEGFVVVYGDTDSVFVKGCTADEFQKFVVKCNVELYPRIMAEVGCLENHVELDYEKEFERVIFMRKKRYIGRYRHYKGKAATADSKPEIKGIEFKRGDSARLARDLQEEVVNLFVGTADGGVEDPSVFEEVLTRWRTRILEGELGLDLVLISKTLNKELGEYKRSTKKDGEFKRQLPHIEIARDLEQRGIDVGAGAKIEYVMVDCSSSPKRCVAAIDWDGKIDRASFWKTVIAPPTLRILEAAFITHNWKPFLKCEVDEKPKRRQRSQKQPSEQLAS